MSEMQSRKRPFSLVAPSSPPVSSVVTLNVGGRLYPFNRQTLAASPRGVLQRMFSGDFADAEDCACDAAGNPFIDRDPDTFAVVAAYLRLGDAVVPDGVPLPLARLELDYFFFDPVLPVTPGMLALTQSPFGGFLRTLATDLRKQMRNLARKFKVVPLGDNYYYENRQLRPLAGKVTCGAGDEDDLLFDLIMGGSSCTEHWGEAMLTFEHIFKPMRESVETRVRRCDDDAGTACQKLYALATHAQPGFPFTLSDVCTFMAAECQASSVECIFDNRSKVTESAYSLNANKPTKTDVFDSERAILQINFRQAPSFVTDPKANDAAADEAALSK